jgi:hypothetical protein
VHASLESLNAWELDACVVVGLCGPPETTEHVVGTCRGPSHIYRGRGLLYHFNQVFTPTVLTLTFFSKLALKIIFKSKFLLCVTYISKNLGVVLARSNKICTHEVDKKTGSEHLVEMVQYVLGRPSVFDMRCCMKTVAGGV